PADEGRRFHRPGPAPMTAVPFVFILLVPLPLFAQSFTQRGFLETTAIAFPQTTPGDGSHAVAESLLRYEAFYKLLPALRFAGSIDARTDTHHETERTLGFGWWDRTRQRPFLAVRRLSATYTRGKLTLEAGKQLIRWGKADVLNPTDRFAPRWNHIGAIAEYSFTFYNGYDHLPLYRVQPNFTLLRADIQRYYPQLRMVGADAALPLGPLTLKSEAAYLTSSTPQSDEYVLYVFQLERQTGEWSLVGGYAGQAITQHRDTLGFSPVRGFTRAFVAHAAYTIDVNRSLAC